MKKERNKKKYNDLTEDEIYNMMKCFANGEGHCLSCKIKIQCNEVENYSLYLVEKYREQIKGVKNEKD